MTRQGKAYIFAFLAVLCWSTVASAFKLTLRQVDYLTLLFYSSLTSALFLLVVLVVQGKAPALLLALRPLLGATRNGGGPGAPGHSPAGGGRDSSRRNALLRSAANGFLNPFLYYVILFKAYSLLPAQEAQPLNYTWPLALVLLSAPMLGEKIRPVSILALLVSFLGVLIVSTHGDLLAFKFTNPSGALLAVGSAVVWALFWLTNVRDDRDEVLKLFLNFLFGFVYTLIAIVIIRIVHRDAPGLRVLPAALAGSVYVGVFEMGAAFVLWLKALQLTDATARVSNLIFLSPFISLIFIRFVVGERILPSSIIGLGFIAGGILVQRTVRTEAPSKERTRLVRKKDVDRIREAE